jgi:hypothetical protein
MKNTYIFICIATMQVLSGICNAQTIELKTAPANVTIDGDAKEWANDLSYSNNKAKVMYTLSNDKDNFYLVIKTSDAAKQSGILGSGITLGIDTRGKKKPSFSITYPISDQEDQTSFMHMNAEQTKAQAELSGYRKIRTEGFAAISDAQLTTTNVYGIKIAIGYDTNGYLIYEEAIPLSLFPVDDLNKEWAFNIKINELDKKVKAPNFDVQSTSDISQAGESTFGNKGNEIHISSTGSSDAWKTWKKVSILPSIDWGGRFNLASSLGK